MDEPTESSTVAGSARRGLGMISSMPAGSSTEDARRPMARAILLDCIDHYRKARRLWEDSEVEYARAAERLREATPERRAEAEEDLARHRESWSNLAYRRLTSAERHLILAIQVWYGYSKTAWDVEQRDYLWQTAGVAHEGQLYIAAADRDRRDATLAVVELGRLTDLSAGEPGS